jgi:hypothetical protein
VRAVKVAVGLLVAWGALVALGYATGVMDGSDPARWCADHSLMVTGIAEERGDTWGQACLDLYEKREP